MCVRRHKELVELVRDSNGNWQAYHKRLEHETKWHDTIMAPFGKHAVALIGDAAADCACVCPYDLNTHRQHESALCANRDSIFCWFGIDWAPTSPAWPQLYAYMHDVFPEPTGGHAAQSVVLVDSSTHRALGTWKLTTSTHACHPQGVSSDVKKRARRLKWSCDGKHLAVFCTDCVQVLTFENFENVGVSGC